MVYCVACCNHNPKDNAAKYGKDEVETIESRIMRAAKRHGVEIDPVTAD